MEKLEKMYLGTETGEYEEIGNFEYGSDAARYLIHSKGYTLEQIQKLGIYTEDECVFSEHDLI